MALPLDCRIAADLTVTDSETMRNAVMMDSETYRHSAAEPRRPAKAERSRLPDMRYPYRAQETQHPHPSATFEREQAWIAEGDAMGLGRAYQASRTGGRARAAMLIVIAVVALSAFAAIGWLQYQSSTDREDPQYEITQPSRSVPALADSAGR